MNDQPVRVRREHKRSHAGGPASKAGRSRSSLNATKHGLFASRWRLPDEDGQELSEHVGGVFASFKPATHAEAEVVRKVAFLMWRMRRVERYDAAAAAYIGDCSVKRAEDPEEASRPGTPHPIDARRLACLSDGKAMEKVLRVESHLQRQLTKAIETLHVLRGLRN